MKKQYLWLVSILLCSYAQAPVEEKQPTYIADDDHGGRGGRGRGDGHGRGYDHHDDRYYHHRHWDGDDYDDDGYDDGAGAGVGGVGVYVGDPEDSYEDPSVRDRTDNRTVD